MVSSHCLYSIMFNLIIYDVFLLDEIYQALLGYDNVLIQS